MVLIRRLHSFDISSIRSRAADKFFHAPSHIGKIGEWIIFPNGLSEGAW